LTQGYWYGHRAIDIGAPIGSAIYASDGGFVSFVGWTDIGYGYLVVVDHNNSYQTYYAHLSNIFVSEGQVVSAGEVIGAMGSTGNSTGPHLHFEIRLKGYPTDPTIYLH
jgi:murein DD-endopeptidase MepM/ murein hydrolase activator NlpD